MADPLQAQDGSPAGPAIATGFESLGIGQPLLAAAARVGWLQPTEVQSQAIPAVLEGRDLRVQAPTGTGKTASYLLPLLQALLSEPARLAQRPYRLHALVLVPTRELATQVGAAAKALAPQVRTEVAVGGLSINPQLMALRGGTHLLVATPGRLLDLKDHRVLHLPDLRMLVLDEADRLLDGGFIDETRQVLAVMPRRRQTLMFSATWSQAARALAQTFQPEALALAVEAPAKDSSALATADTGDGAHASASPALASIAQRCIVVETARRTQLLRHLIQSGQWPRALVFVATQHATEHIASKLWQAGIRAAALHGQLSQGRRAQVLQDLANGQLSVLVSTDLAARGLDVPLLEAVVNYDLPRSASDHAHRIGRTGRAGAGGHAVSFVLADAPGSEAHFRLIEKRQQLRVAREQVEGFEPSQVLPVLPSDPNGGVKGRRVSKKDKLRAAQAAQAKTVKSG